MSSHNNSVIEEDKPVKKVRDGVYKDIYEVNGDKVEKVERDGKRFYYVISEDKLDTLKKGTKVTISKSGLYKEVNLMGMALVDDTDLKNERVISIRPFKTDDHEQEAKDVLKNLNYRHHRK